MAREKRFPSPSSWRRWVGTSSSYRIIRGKRYSSPGRSPSSRASAPPETIRTVSSAPKAAVAEAVNTITANTRDRIFFIRGSSY